MILWHVSFADNSSAIWNLIMQILRCGKNKRANINLLFLFLRIKKKKKTILKKKMELEKQYLKTWKKRKQKKTRKKEGPDMTSLCHPLTRAGYGTLRNAETKPGTRIPVDFSTRNKGGVLPRWRKRELPWLRSGLSNKLFSAHRSFYPFPTDSSKKNFSRRTVNRKQPPHSAQSLSK